jgi:hypothetical protein
LAEYRALRGAADAVGYSAEASVAELDELRSARMRSALMRAIREETPADGASPADGARPPIAPPAAVTTRPPWAAYAAVAAALVIALLSVFNNAALRSQNQANQDRIAALERTLDEQLKSSADLRARLDASDARLAALLAPGAKHFPIPQGEVIENGGRVFLALHSLPPLAPGKVFQAWTVAKGAKGVAPSITFSAGANGTALVELPEPAGNLAAVALTVEPDGGSKTPTSKPSFVRKLS